MSLSLNLYRNFRRKIDLYLSVKQYEPSRELIESKLSSHPDDPRLRKLLALISIFQEKNDQAFRILEQLEKQEPRDKEIKLLLLALYCDLGRYKEAREFHLKLQENASSFLGKSLGVERLADEFIACGLTLYKSNLFSRAVVQFSQALTLCPESSEAVVLLAKAHIKLKKSEHALHLLKDFCKNYAASSDVYLWLGLVYLDLGKTSLAQFHLEKARDLNPGGRLAELYLRYIEEK